MPFFVELPADEYGNTAYPLCVMEAEIEHDDFGEILLVKAPPEIAVWPRIYRKLYGGWLECEGPARLLTWDEQKELVASLQADI